MPKDAARQSLPTEPDGSDSEVLVDGTMPSDNLLVDGAVPSDNSGFKIPDVPKPSTGADEVADWAAEVGVSIFFGGGAVFGLWGVCCGYMFWWYFNTLLVQVRPSMRKLRQGMDSLLKTSRLMCSVLRLQQVALWHWC